MPTILIVEDERNLAHLIRDNLEEQGYRVRLAFDGPSALTMFEAMEKALVPRGAVDPAWLDHQRIAHFDQTAGDAAEVSRFQLDQQQEAADEHRARSCQPIPARRPRAS